jgi:hypothetical protein
VLRNGRRVGQETWGSSVWFPNNDPFSYSASISDSLEIVQILKFELPCPCSAANVIFEFEFYHPNTIPKRPLPIFTHLQKYPKLERLILDGSAIDRQQASLLTELPVAQSICLSDNQPFDNTLSGIKSLRIHMVGQFVENSELNATMLSNLIHTIYLPKLRDVHITMTLSWEPSGITRTGEWSDIWKATFRSLNIVADTWRSLDMIKLCAKVILPYGSTNERLSERFLRCNIWVRQDMYRSISLAALTLMASFQRDALAEIVQAFKDDPACKIEFCILYSWDYAGLGPPLDLFQQSPELQWALVNNLAPVDEDSLRVAIQHIQFQRKISIPDFDLCIRYYDINDGDRVSRDLVSIRHRTSQTDDGSGANVQRTEPGLIGSLDCDVNRGLMKELHRHSWICDRGLPL